MNFPPHGRRWLIFPRADSAYHTGPQHGPLVDHTTARMHGFVEQLNNRGRYDQTAPLYY
jgi:hypothetical protein